MKTLKQAELRIKAGLSKEKLEIIINGNMKKQWENRYNKKFGNRIINARLNIKFKNHPAYKEIKKWIAKELCELEQRHFEKFWDKAINNPKQSITFEKGTKITTLTQCKKCKLETKIK